MSAHPLDRPVWGALNGPQSPLGVAQGAAVRLDPRYGPFAAARDGSPEAQEALAAVLGDDDEIWLVEPHAWAAPAGTRVTLARELVQMIAAEPQAPQPHDPESDLLGEADAAEMAALARATQPGPWGERTRLYGQFHGIRREGRLVAMAGVRMRPAAGLVEVSGVCTYPEHRGKGLAAALIRRVMADITAAGAVPFLHSWASNRGAIALYRALGFEVRRAMVATALRRE